MKKLIGFVTALIMALGLALPAAAADNPDDAVAMVKKAVAHLKKAGREQALADFNAPTADFKKGDLYIFVTTISGKALAHGANPKLIGKELIDLKDADGKYFVRAYSELATSKGSGWVDYKWINPVSKAFENKSSYIEKLDDLIIGYGIYK
jgi:signal transduction histidine kinase